MLSLLSKCVFIDVKFESLLFVYVIEVRVMNMLADAIGCVKFRGELGESRMGVIDLKL